MHRPASDPSFRRRRPAGWSLIEIVVATALVLALLGVGIPIALRVFERGELAATEENVAAELLKARAEAQSSGRPVEVLIDRDPSRIIQRYFTPGAGAGLDRRVDRNLSRDGGAKPARTARNEPKGAAWRRESSIDPAVTVDTAKGASEAGAEERRSGAGGPTRIAVFMPDGSILFAASVILMHESGLRSQVSLDPYTGHPAVERVAAAADGEGESDANVERDPPTRGSGPADDALRFERAP
jgi:type II secretory pathway pseudopilin PulG